MAAPLLLLRLAGKAALNAFGGGIAGDIVFEAIPELASNLWDHWHKERNADQRRADLEAVARVPTGELKLQVADLVQEIAADRPLAQQQALGLYLELLPGQVRHSLRRPSDPHGGTVPYEMIPAKADDLIALLPDRLPRFKPGDRPLPSVDWELDELLGMGGFGEVWKAKNPHLKSAPPVALKFCLDPSDALYLRNEAAVLDRVMRQGRHPGIISLQHTYLGAATPCLEYEFVAGGDLAGLVQEWHRGTTKPSPVDAARVVLELADIIAFAHSRPEPIVHRDLKPANVLRQFGPNGTSLKIADFGIGGLATKQAIQQTRASSRGMFLATALRGSCTPLYASPQQMRGDAPDPRDDVFALGVIWYQLLTGNLTAGRPGGNRWRKKLADQGMSEELADVLSECLEDDLVDRLADGAALAQRLRAVLPAADSPAPSPAPPAPPAPTILTSPKPAAKALPADPRQAEQLRLEERLANLTYAIVSAENPDPAVLAERGEVNRLLGRQAKAIEDCTEAIRLNVKMANAYSTRASAYRLSGQPDLAIADATQALELDANDKLSWYTRAESQRVRGQFDKAIADANEALRLDAEYTRAYGTRGAAYQAKGDQTQAIADLNEYLRRDPGNAWALVTRAESHRLGRVFDLAIADCNEALRLQPESSQALATRGAAFRQKGDFATGMADLHAALRLRPDNQFARDQLRLAQRRQR